MISKRDLISEVKDQIGRLYKDFRFFHKVLLKFSELDEVKNLKARIGNLAYDAEYTVDLFVVDSIMSKKNMMMMPKKDREEIAAIKTEVKEIYEKKIYKKGKGKGKGMANIQVGSSRANTITCTWDEEIMHKNEINQMKDDDKLGEQLYKGLKGRRYFIVMDDIWNGIKAWDDLKILFPNDNNGSRIMFTSRHREVGLHAKPINKGKSLEVWNHAKETLNSQMDVDPQLWMKTLSLGYNLLPHHLKPCFLYFGAFPEDFEIPVRKLIWLWIAEGFIRKTGGKCLEDVAEEYLMDLIDRSLVLVSRRGYNSKIKACPIHDLLHDYCLRKVDEEYFLQRISNIQHLPSSSKICFERMRRIGIDTDNLRAMSENQFFFRHPSFVEL
ncbi:hypothetical protein ACSBR1_040086 [Camellia fascicularis]